VKIKTCLEITTIILLLAINLVATSAELLVHGGSCADSGTYIDVFTQNIRYDGKGQNEPTDLFGPQDLVILYSLVRANGEPVIGKLVSYEITGPPSTHNLKFYQVAETNASGIAETLFSLLHINHTDAFGLWTVIARVDVAGNQYIDTLAFQVNWLVELRSLRTLDENLNESSTFGLGGYVGVEITLRNNAWTPKTTRLGVTLFDELNVPVDSFEVTNLTLPPDEKDWHIYGKLATQKYAVPGRAMITAVALDANSSAYCPEISTVLWLTIYNPVQADFVDGAVFLDVWPVKAEPGIVIPVTVVIRNEGTVALNNLNVTLHTDGLVPVSRSISSLEPYAFYVFYDNWDTTGMPEGNYTITANLQTYPQEADLTDNNFTSTIELKREPVCVHDIQVTNVTCSTYEVCQGQTIDLRVTVRNNGNSTEATNVRAYYGAHLIGEQSIMELAPHSERIVVFHWNTAGIPEGVYQMSATATSVQGETNTADNTYVDGSVRIRICPQIIHDVAVIALSASPNEIVAGDPVSIVARVKNLGSLAESFTLRFFYDDVQIDESHITSLAPNEERSQAINWNTTGMPEGSYVIKAYIPPLFNETTIANNLYVDGAVLITGVHPPTPKHDVAVTAVNASEYQAYVGDSIEITVVAANIGDFPETFNLTTYANMLEIHGWNSLFLQPNSSTTLSFSWNTSSLSPGNYSIWAFASPVPGEADTANNYFVDGTVTLLSLPSHYIHDVAVVAVQPESRIILVGETVEVHVRVKNFGNVTESFNVTLYYDSTSTGTEMVHLLAPNSEQMFLFEWNTSNVGVGNYTLKAHAEPVPGETNLENNWFTDGTVEVKTLPPSITHDIAVTWLSANTTEAYAGENVTIDAMVQNLGDTPESFKLTIYYDTNLIQTITIESLAPNTTLPLVIIWNTKNVEPGTYVLNANATILPNEVDTENNFFEDGQVSIIPDYEILLWLLLIPFLIGLALITLLLLLLLLKRRRRKRPTAMLTYAIVSHPHI